MNRSFWFGFCGCCGGCVFGRVNIWEFRFMIDIGFDKLVLLVNVGIFGGVINMRVLCVMIVVCLFGEMVGKFKFWNVGIGIFKINNN